MCMCICPRCVLLGLWADLCPPLHLHTCACTCNFTFTCTCTCTCTFAYIHMCNFPTLHLRTDFSDNTEALTQAVSDSFWDVFKSAGSLAAQLDTVIHLSPSDITCRAEYLSFFARLGSGGASCAGSGSGTGTTTATLATSECTMHIAVGSGNCIPCSTFVDRYVFCVFLAATADHHDMHVCNER